MMPRLSFLVLMLLLCAASIAAPQPLQSAGGEESHYFSARFEALTWQKIIPELGADSPEIAILRVDPATGATQLLIRNPTQIHVRAHWHTANETHTVLRGTMVFECEGKRDTLSPGSFNYIPGKSVHQAWLPDNGLVFITVDAPWDLNWVEGAPTRADVGVAPPAK